MATDPKKVLVVEDEAMLREAYEQILTTKKYKVFVAEDGDDAEKQLKKHQPDLVLLDILMPKVSGVELLEKIDVPKNYPNTVFISFSNISGHAMEPVLLQLGVREHVLKSDLSPSGLTELVHKYLG